MPVLSLKAITDEDRRTRLASARAAYLDDRFDESVQQTVAVYLELVKADPNALDGTRLDRKNRFAGWPDYGITLTDAGTPQVSAVWDGRDHTMASAVCYFEYVLEAVILAQQPLEARTASAPAH